MNRDSLTTQQLWDIERYVLDDNSLDRDAFEVQMAGNIELALAVADCVERLQLIACACRAVPRTQQPSSVVVAAPAVSWTASKTAAQLWLALGLGLAACVLLLVRWDGNWPTSSNTPLAGQVIPRGMNPPANTPRIADVALGWLAMEESSYHWASQELPETVEQVVPSGYYEPSEHIEPSEQNSAASSDDDDWMLQAATEFYRSSDIHSADI